MIFSVNAWVFRGVTVKVGDVPAVTDGVAVFWPTTEKGTPGWPTPGVVVVVPLAVVVVEAVVPMEPLVPDHPVPHGSEKPAVPCNERAPDTDESWLRFSGSKSLMRKIFSNRILSDVYSTASLYPTVEASTAGESDVVLLSGHELQPQRLRIAKAITGNRSPTKRSCGTGIPPG